MIVLLEEIFLHVGLHKTGTTSIQDTLSLKENKKILERKGYLYPKCWDANHSIPVYSAFCDHPEQYHINIRRGLTKTELEKMNNENMKNLKNEVQSKNLPKLILSGEDISVLNSNNLKMFKKFFDPSVKINVIIYVRNPISWAISAIQQVIKDGRTYDFAFNAYNRILKNNFQNQITKFIDVFGVKNVNVYNFDDAIDEHQGIVGHFLSSLNYDFERKDIDELTITRSNESLSLIACQMISCINEQIPFIKDGNINPSRRIGDLDKITKIKGPNYDISYEDKVKLAESCLNDVEWLKNISGIDYTYIQYIDPYSLPIECSEDIMAQINELIKELPLNVKELSESFINKITITQ